MQNKEYNGHLCDELIIKMEDRKNFYRDSTKCKESLRKIESNNEDESANKSDNDEYSSGDEKPPHKKLRLSLPINNPKISPKKRLDVKSLPSTSTETNTSKIEKMKFIYGNYSRYYGYRFTDNFRDIRLDVFNEHKHLFENKEILDIGCNSGFITIAISKQFNVKFITGIDIDKSLINKAKSFIQKNRRYFKETDKNGFPFNINFIHGNYVLRDDVLLDIEKPQFDLILCLSVTKWIHLNFGDAGLKQAFRRMFLQLWPGGKLILEPQPWNGYKRRKNLTPEINKNYQNIKFRPNEFTSYLLSPEVGFSEMYELGIPEHSNKGFKRPIYVFVKNE